MFLASMKSQAVGLSLAVAIALHNVPEGVAVALPVYFATKSRWLGFKYAFLSGVALLVYPTACETVWRTSLDAALIAPLTTCRNLESYMGLLMDDFR